MYDCTVVNHPFVIKSHPCLLSSHSVDIKQEPMQRSMPRYAQYTWRVPSTRDINSDQVLNLKILTPYTCRRLLIR